MMTPSPVTAPVQAKAASLYNICALARDKAGGMGNDDALLLDFRSYLPEATGASLFLVMRSSAKSGKSPTRYFSDTLPGISLQTLQSLT